MISFEAAGQLLGLAAARDQRTVGDADILAWHSDLNASGISYGDADAALTRFYAVEMASLEPDERRRVTTPDIISLARKIRTERLANFIYEPPAGDEDPLYLERLRGQLTATADGVRPALTERPALDGGPNAQLEAVLAGIGRQVPDAEKAPPPVKRAGPLGVPCPKCRAAVGRPCRLPSRGDNPGRERAPHPARTTVATGGQLTDPAVEQAEIERRRAISIRRLEELADPDPESEAS